MNKHSDTFPRLTVYLCQVAALCNLFLFFISTEANGYQSIQMLPWLLLSTALFLMLHRSKNSRPLGQIALMAVAGFVVTGLVMSLWFVHVEGFGTLVAAWVFFAITTALGSATHFTPCSVHQVLLGCELHAMGIALLLWLSEGGVFFLPSEALISTFTVVLLNLIALISMRVGSCGGDWRGQQAISATATLLLVLFQGGFALLVVRFTIGVATAAVSGVTTATRWVGTGLATLITQFFAWLASLIPSPDLQSEAIYEGQEIISVESMEEMTELDPRILILLAVIIGAIALCFVLWLLFKFRHWRLPSLSLNSEPAPEVTRTRTSPLWELLKSLFLAQWAKIQFLHALLTHRNTPQGAVILLSRVGGSRGLSRQQGESYGNYLARLAPLCTEKNPAVAQSLAALSTSLDSALYGTHQGENPLSPADYGRMLRVIARLPRQK